MRTVYLGTSDVRRRGAASGSPPARTGPALVVTRPDRPAGRGRKLAAPPVAERGARRSGIEVVQPERRQRRGGPRPDRRGAARRRVVCAFGALIKEPLLSDHEMLNVHPSLLPRWRGAAPIERAIMAGDAETGVVDHAPHRRARHRAGLPAREPSRSRPTTTTARSRRGSQRLGGELLVRALDERPPFAEQDEAGVTYAEKIDADDRTLDPARPAAELERVVRALHPHIGARVALPTARCLRVARRGRPDAGRRRARSAARRRPLLSAAPAARSSCSSVQPPGGAADGGRRLPARPRRPGADRRREPPLRPARTASLDVVRSDDDRGSSRERG